MPKSNKSFWEQKISNTIQRDKIAKKALEKEGWKVITIWECALKPRKREKTLADLLKKLKELSS